MAKTAAKEHLSPVVGEDLDADDQAAEAAEALNRAVVTLEWKGQTFTLPKRRGRWPTRAAREFGRENHLGAIVALLGEEAWARLEELCPVVDDINEFANYAGEKIAAECIP
ncbi:tail assembly chaperone [Mycobacterium phage Weirdo19]|uniref:Tail assembly chaperone n=1 Tax=Mycobacterium phage Weirdo19 TaxID=2601610 RepID=A0A6M2YSP0_9CAUD|nr:tail assembly chaperone [Mycobacterium phage Weirdo19]QEA10783.1 tail assembly chaperone [Mycobacterium phage Weirdo19]